MQSIHLIMRKKTRLGCYLYGMLAIFALYVSAEVGKSSQCFKSRGIPKVSFKCEKDEMIQIQRAFHGIADPARPTIDQGDVCTPSPGHTYTNCTFCEGDCVDDSMNLVYDWSTCIGNETCVRTVLQSYMPKCKGPSKFSEYLQVEYQCVKRAETIDVCSAAQTWLSEGFIMSPNYPQHYPINQDCLCTLVTDWNAKIMLSFYDLLLETKNGRCRADWLMLRQHSHKHRHCGAILTGSKNMTSQANSITLQFHSDGSDNKTQNFQYFERQLKGFWLYFTAQPKESSIQVTCRRLDHNDKEVQEIWEDDSKFNEVVSTQDIPSTTPQYFTPTLEVEELDQSKGSEGNKKKENEVHKEKKGTPNFGKPYKKGEQFGSEGDGSPHEGRPSGGMSYKGEFLIVISHLMMYSVYIVQRVW